jgi:hypothetical protein
LFNEISADVAFFRRKARNARNQPRQFDSVILGPGWYYQVRTSEELKEMMKHRDILFSVPASDAEIPSGETLGLVISLALHYVRSVSEEE